MSAIQTLPRHQALALAGGSGIRLLVLEGRLWATRSGDPQDHFLGPGDSLADLGVRLVVEADGCAFARFCLQVAQAEDKGVSPRHNQFAFKRPRPAAPSAG